MRIRRSSGSTRHHFIVRLRQWMRFRRPDAQSSQVIAPVVTLAVVGATATAVALAVIVGTRFGLEGRQAVHPLLPALLVKAKDTVRTTLNKNGLPVLHLDIDPQDYRAMERRRDEALRKGILLLEDADWTHAQIRLRNETIPIYIRLKGYSVDHLQEGKWSFQVRVQNGVQVEHGPTISGMRSFSLQSPATCRYLNEWLYVEDLYHTGILAPRYLYVNVLVNDADWGIYALQESISSELLTSQGRQPGVIVHVDGSLFWRYRALFSDHQAQEETPIDPISAPLDLAAFAQAQELSSTGVQGDPMLSEQRLAALGRLQAFQSHKLPASQAFDAEQMGRYLAHTNLWGARHGLKWHNERFYYNPLTSRLEPIGHDPFPLGPVDTPFVDLAQYDDLQIMEAYAQEVTRISQPEYLDEFRSAYAQEFERYYIALAREFASMDLEVPWDTLSERQVLLWDSLHPPQTVHAYWIASAAQTGSEPSSALNIQVSNLLRYPVVLRQVRLGEQEIDVQADWILQEDSVPTHESLIHGEAMPAVVLRRAQGDAPRYVALRIPVTVLRELAPQETTLFSDTLQLVTQLVGVDEPVVVDVQRDYPPLFSEFHIPAQPSVEEALRQHPYLQQADQAGYLEIKPGTWNVEGDLVLPDGYGLQATQPVTLAFDRQAVLFASGPLLLHGPDRDPIRLVPKDDNWGGIFVFQADPAVPSSLRNVEFQATSGIQREGWRTAGGITFYESPVVFNGSHLNGSTAHAAVHIVHSYVEFVRTRFENVAAHAFDGDLVQGRIEQTTFFNVRGDGIQLTGSQIDVEDIDLLRIYGHGISAGENSAVTIASMRAADVHIPILSKDLSVVHARNVQIAQVWTAAVAAYQDKMERGTARIDASDVRFADDSVQALVQEGSTVTINGAVATASELDMDELNERRKALASMRDLDHQFGSAIKLIGYKLATPEPRPGDTLALTLYWQSLAKIDRDYTVFVHIRDASGQTAAGFDNMPRQDNLPTTQWQVGRLVDDTHLIPLPAGMPPGEYSVALGMYYLQTGERLPIVGPQGEVIPNAEIVLEQRVRIE